MIKYRLIKGSEGFTENTLYLPLVMMRDAEGKTEQEWPIKQIEATFFITDAPQFGSFDDANEAHEFCASLENDVFNVGYSQAETVPQPEWVV